MTEHALPLTPATDEWRAFSKKWHACPPNGISLDLADMDFSSDPAVTAAVRRELDHPLVYPPDYRSNGTAETITDFYSSRYGLRVAPADVWLSSSCVAASYLLFDQLLVPGDEVLYFSPSYHFIVDSISAAGGRPVAVELPSAQSSSIFRHLLAAKITPRTRAIYLCNPNNPTGFVFSRTELEYIADLAQSRDLLIVSNELHSRLMLEGEHIPIATLSEDMRSRTVTLSGPTKSHNISGLGVAFGLTPPKGPLKDASCRIAARMTVPKSLQQAALKAAYAEDSPWLLSTIKYLRENRDTALYIFDEMLPSVHMTPPQATYFLWLDLRQLGLDRDAADLIRQRTGVCLTPGREFGCDGRHWARMTFATYRPIIEAAVHLISSGMRWTV